MFNYPAFEVALSRQVRVSELGWPEAGEAAGESCLGCNRAYIDLRRLTWGEAKRVLAEETNVITRIEKAEKSEDEYSIIEEESYESDIDLYGLDIGVASTVVALSAARCVPFSSCNAGAFGGTHHENYPIVAFYAKPKTANLLLVVAIEVDVGIENGAYGCLVVFSNDIRKFPRFADAMIRRRSEFNSLQLSTPRTAKRRAVSVESAQFELPL